MALGREGETQAAAYLRRRGYRILARNVRAGGVEIDIIAAKAQVIAFVEVKTRRQQCHGTPEEAVDARKQARLLRGAAAWLRDQRPHHPRLASAYPRFDVIACEPAPEGRWIIRHLPAAFDGN